MRHTFLLELLQKRLDSIDPFIDLLHAGREAQSNVRVEAAVVAGDDGDVVLFEQGCCKAHRVGDLFAADAF